MLLFLDIQHIDKWRVGFLTTMEMNYRESFEGIRKDDIIVFISYSMDLNRWQNFYNVVYFKH